MLDVAKRTSASTIVGLIEANLAAAPEVARFPARTIHGTSYHTLLRTDLPTVQFTGVNEGVDASKSNYETKLVETFPLRALIQIDKALISADTPERTLMTDESMGVAEAAMRKIGRQIWYGRASGKADAKGHIGLIDVVSNGMLVNATGTTPNQASSVYLVKFGIKDVQIIFGQDTVLALPPFRDETLTDANGKQFDGKVSHLTGWVGLQCVNPNSVARICNITAENGKGLTDPLLAKALAKFPAGYRPDAIFAPRRCIEQLETARSAVASLQLSGKKETANGHEIYAGEATHFRGIPIVPTDSLIDTEAIVP